MAARAVLRAAERPQRREYRVGTSTTATLLAKAFAPGLLDRYLARNGLCGHQTDQPSSADDPAKLSCPADWGRDFGAHGRVDGQTINHDPQPWASQHHGAVAAVGAGLAGAAVALASSRRG